MSYLLLLFIVVLINLLPAFAPPTWTVLVFAIASYKLELIPTIIAGVAGATIGRFILASYINWFSKKIFNDKQIENLGYLGQKLGNTPTRNIVFTFIYSITPLSTTALFVAAGIAKVRLLYVMIGFFFGRIVAYSWLAKSTQLVGQNITDLFRGIWSIETVVSTLIGLIAILAFIFIDWELLIEKRKLRLNFQIWKWNR